MWLIVGLEGEIVSLTAASELYEEASPVVRNLLLYHLLDLDRMLHHLRQNRRVV